MAEPGDQREAEAQGNMNQEAATLVITDIVDARLQASMEAIVSNRQQGDWPGEPQHE